MDRMKKEKKEKRSILPGVIIVSLLVAAVVYAVLLNAEKTALSDYEKGFAFFQKFMKEQGIIEQLESLGIEEGDTVYLGDLEFDYYR